MCGYTSHLILAPLAQVVGEVLVDVVSEDTGVLRVQLQHLTEGPNADVLEVAVGQRLYIRVGLDHLV